MTDLYIIRHAEAEGNLFRRIHGHYNSNVTHDGLKQIAALERRFQTERIDVCYSSDLVRTRVTARAVYGPRDLPLRLEPGFREVYLGPWEDLPFGLLEREQRDQLAAFSHRPRDWHVDGAEDYDEYQRRFLDTLERVAQRHDGKTVAIFTHGCVIRAMLEGLFPGQEAGHCDNTGVTRLEYDGGQFREIYRNDNSHLPENLSTFAKQNWWRKDRVRRDRNLWFRPLGNDPQWYVQCRREAWEGIYGPGSFPDGAAYYADAVGRAAGEPWAICQAMLGDEPAGLLQLDLNRGADQRVGYIPFLYLLPEFRRMGLGVQLIGQAVSFYRRLGRTHLQLAVSPENPGAVRFYQRYGMTQTGTVAGAGKTLWLMDFNMDLTRDLEPALIKI